MHRRMPRRSAARVAETALSHCEYAVPVGLGAPPDAHGPESFRAPAVRDARPTRQLARRVGLSQTAVSRRFLDTIDGAVPLVRIRTTGSQSWLVGTPSRPMRRLSS
jgi:hypothetical protein